MQSTYGGCKAWGKTQIKVFAQSQISDDVDVVAWKGLALYAKDIWVLAEVLEVHVEVVVVQPHVESKV